MTFFSADGRVANDLAAQMSALQDGYRDNQAFESLFSGDSSIGGFSVFRAPGLRGAAFDGLANFDVGLTTWDAVEQDSDIGTTMLSDNPIQEAIDSNAGVPWPTPYSPPDYITQQSGLIRSEDLGAYPGMDAMSYEAETARRGLGFADVSTTSLQGLANLAQTQPNNPRVRDYRAVVKGALLAGTPVSGKVAQGLLRKAKKLAALADERARVTADARRGFAQALQQARLHDHSALRTARQLLDEKGNFKPGTTDTDVLRLKKTRERAFEAGRRAIRYQKVNLLGQVLTNNAIAQADLAQKMAAAVLSGNAGAAAALGAMYDEIGLQSQQVRELRKKQVSRWQNDQKGGLGTADPYEAEINSIELAWGGFIKKAYKKAKKKAKGLAKKAAPFIKPLKETAKIALAPVKATVQAGKALSKGNFKGAFKSIGKSVVDTAKSLKSVAASALIDMPCALSKSKLGQTASQIAGTAIGTFYGGPVGGAAGSEAAKHANRFEQSACGALKRIGLNEGKFRRGQIKGAFNKVGKDLWNNTLHPKAALKTAANVGMAYLTAGAGVAAGSSVSAFGTDTIRKLGLNNLQDQVKNQLQTQGKKYLQKQAMKYTQQLSKRVVGADVSRLVQQGAALAPIVRDQGFDVQSLLRSMQGQGINF